MAADKADVPTVQDTTPAVLFALGLPAGSIGGWTVIGELPTGEFKVTSSICCTRHLMAMLSTVVAQLAGNEAWAVDPAHVT